MNKQILIEDIRVFAENFDLGEKLRNKTFLVTGATGLIGSVLIKCLLALNRRNTLGIMIIAVVRDMDKAKYIFEDDFSEVNFIKINLSEINISSIGNSVDYIVHLANPTASKFYIDCPVETLRTAVEGTISVLEYAKSAKIKAMVYASSLEVYGSNLTEDRIDEVFQGYVNPLVTRSSYNIGKRTAECLCYSYAMEYNVPVMIARLTQTFGAGVNECDNRVFAQFAHKVIERENIELHTKGDSCRMYCYTVDAVIAILYILIKGEIGEAYNIANKETYISIKDMACFVRDKFCKDIAVCYNLKDDQGYAPQTKLRLDTTKIESLGWKPIYSLEMMFKRLIMYLR